MTDPASIRAIDAVVNIWTEEALSHRPGWGDEFFVGKMKAKSNIMSGLSLEDMVQRMDSAGVEPVCAIDIDSGERCSDLLPQNGLRDRQDCAQRYGERFLPVISHKGSTLLP